MSFLDIIEHFSSGDDVGGLYQVTRYAAREYDNDGKLVAVGAPTILTVTAGVQPTNGRDLQVLAEAGVTSESQKIFTEVPLQTRRPGQEPDEILISGDVWVAHNASIWKGFDEVVYVTLVARKEQS